MLRKLDGHTALGAFVDKEWAIPAGESVVSAVLISAGATLVIDLWAVLLRQVGVSPLQMALLGRRIGHLPDGRWVHTNVAAAAPVWRERWIGWRAHYAIGITFAALLLRVEELEWARGSRPPEHRSQYSTP